MKAHEVWAKWVAEELSSTVQEALTNDPGLISSQPLSAWQEIVVKQVSLDPQISNRMACM